jgi:hypothetical protein
MTPEDGDGILLNLTMTSKISFVAWPWFPVSTALLTRLSGRVLGSPSGTRSACCMETPLSPQEGL